MKLGILIILLILVGLGVFSLYREGGVLSVAYREWLLEMPLWLAVLGIIAVWLFSYFLLKSVDVLQTAKAYVSSWVVERQNKTAKHRLLEGFSALVEGNWKKAERLLENSPRHLALFANFGTFYAAEVQGHHDQRDRALAAILAEYPTLKTPLFLLVAQCQLHNKQYREALVSLNQINSANSQHPTLLALKKKIYDATQDIQNLFDLIPLLKKHKVISEQDAKTHEANYYEHHLTQVAKSASSFVMLIQEWKKIPKAARMIPSLTAHYCDLLTSKGEGTLAEKELRDALSAKWNDTLIYKYGLVNSLKPEKQLEQAEKWLLQHPQNQNLLLTLGRLCLKMEWWEKAKQYFEASLQVSPSASAYYELAGLSEQLGEKNLSFEYLRKGLERCISQKHQLPT